MLNLYTNLSPNSSFSLVRAEIEVFNKEELESDVM